MFKHLVLALPRVILASVIVKIQTGQHLLTMIQRFIFLSLLHLSTTLFETCDETLTLETDAHVTISSGSTLNARNVSSCRYTLVAPVNYIVDVTCTLQIDQPDSHKCPLKRFFVSVDGIKDLRGADYFCSRSGSSRRVRRRSVMNRLVLGYATQVAVGEDKFTCEAKRIASRCDCGWSRKVCCSFETIDW